MFKVIDKRNGSVIDIYDATHENNHITKFLYYDLLKEGWEWELARYFEPYDDEQFIVMDDSNRKIITVVDKVNANCDYDDYESRNKEYVIRILKYNLLRRRYRITKEDDAIE